MVVFVDDDDDDDASTVFSFLWWVASKIVVFLFVVVVVVVGLALSAPKTNSAEKEKETKRRRRSWRRGGKNRREVVVISLFLSLLSLWCLAGVFFVASSLFRVLTETLNFQKQNFTFESFLKKKRTHRKEIWLLRTPPAPRTLWRKR